MATAPSLPIQEPSNASVKAWKTHVLGLNPTERRLFEKFIQGDLQGYIQAVDRARKDQEQTSWTFKTTKWMEPLFNVLNMYMPIASAAAQAYPNPSTLVLGGISCIMQMSSGVVRFQDLVTQKLSYFSRKIEVLKDYDENLYQSEPDVQDALVSVYGDLLAFCKRALQYLVNEDGKVKSGLKVLSLSLLKPLDNEFSDITAKFDDDLEDLESKAVNCDRLRILSIVQSQSDMLTEQRRAAVALASFDERMALYINRETARAKERKMSAVLQWLPSTDFAKHYDEKCKMHLEGTGQWLLDNAKYISWKRGSSSTILRVVGKAGSGKSMLSAIAINDLNPIAHPGVGVAYAFCSFEDEKARNPLVIINTIVKQLYKQNAGGGAAMLSLFDTKADIQPNGPTWEQVSKIVHSLLSDFDEVFIVIDGLDECEENERLANFALDVVKEAKSTFVKVILFYRSEHYDIDAPLEEFPLLEVNSAANSEDIEKYIDNAFSDRKFTAQRTPLFLESVKKVQEALKGKADGMFLFVYLFVKSLGKSTTPNQMLAKIKKLPNDLSKVYDLSMTRIYEQDEDDRDTALKVLLWTLNSRRPLSEDEMLEAVAIKPGSSCIDEGDVLPDGRLLTALCADLVLLDSDRRFVLVHASLKDYAVDDASKSLALFPEYQSLQLKANEILATSCISYLLFDHIQNIQILNNSDFEKVLHNNKFLSYAGRYWGDHVKGECEQKLREIIMTLLLCEASKLSIHLNILAEKMTLSFPWERNPVYLPAILGLLDTVKEFENIHEIIEDREGGQASLLDYAARYSQRDVCSWLLDQISFHSDRQLGRLNGAMHIAITLGWPDIVQKMINKGFDIELNAGDVDNMNTPLTLAIIDGRDDIAKILLDAGAEAAARNDQGDTPLILAAYEKNLPMTCMLIERGADINAQNETGVAPLHYAASLGCLEIMQRLVSAGAHIDAVAPGWQSQTAMHVAAEKNYPGIIQFLFEQGASINALCDMNSTPLHVAAWFGSLKAAQCLVDLGAKWEVIDEHQRTPAHCAAINGHFDMLVYLRKLGLNMDTPAYDGSSVLVFASKCGHLDIVEFLIKENVDIEGRKSNGRTALYESLLSSRVDVATTLVKNGANVNAMDEFGNRALNYAAFSGLADIISQLLDAGADVKAKSEQGHTALHANALSGDVKFLTRLLELCPDVDLDVQNAFGETALHTAVSNDHPDFVSCLIFHRAKSLPNKEGDHPIHLSVISGSNEILLQLLNKTNVNTPGYKGNTLLHLAANLGRLGMAKRLLEEGAMIDMQNSFGHTPLIESILQGKSDIAHFLLDRGADYTLVSKRQRTVLHEVARAGEISLCERIMSNADVDPLALDSAMLSPFGEAVRHNNLDIVKQFLSKGYNDTRVSEDGSCSHAAAAGGDLQMFRTILENGGSAVLKNHFEVSPLHSAAVNGSSNILEHLISLKAPINEVTIEGRTALSLAASGRYPKSVQTLATNGAALELTTPFFSRTPLIYAVLGGGSETINNLIDAKANMEHVDAYGLRPVDYAHRNAFVWKLVGKYFPNYKSIPGEERLLRLKNTIRECCRKLADEHRLSDLYYHENRRSTEREQLLDVLAGSLQQLQKKFDETDVLCVLMESYFSFLRQGRKFFCDICRRSISHNLYVCTICSDVQFCESCSDKWTSSEKNRNELLLERHTIYELETSIRRVRRFLHDYFDFLGPTIVRLLGLSHELPQWIREQWSAYEAWESQCEDASYWINFIRPGFKFLKLLRDTLAMIDEKLVDEVDEASLLTETQYKAFEKELEKLKREDSPDEEFPLLMCCHDDVLHLRKEDYQNYLKTATNVDAQGLLEPKFFQQLLDKLEIGEEAESNQVSLQDRTQANTPPNSRAVRSPHDENHSEIQGISSLNIKQRRVGEKTAWNVTDLEEKPILEKVIVPHKEKMSLGNVYGESRTKMHLFTKETGAYTQVYELHVEAQEHHILRLLRILLLDSTSPGSGIDEIDKLMEDGTVEEMEQTEADPAEQSWQTILAMNQLDNLGADAAMQETEQTEADEAEQSRQTILAMYQAMEQEMEQTEANPAEQSWQAKLGTLAL